MATLATVVVQTPINNWRAAMAATHCVGRLYGFGAKYGAKRWVPACTEMALVAPKADLTGSRLWLTIDDVNALEDTRIPGELMAELQQAAEKAAKGVRDPEERRKARAEMDQIREAIRARHGLLDIGVPAIRELRDS